MAKLLPHSTKRYTNSAGETVKVKSALPQEKPKSRRRLPKGMKDVRLMPKCTYVYEEATRSHDRGEKCQSIAMNDDVFCWWHCSPEQRERVTKVRESAKQTKARSIGAMRGLVLPKDLAGKYEKILGDNQLVELKVDIAFCEARIQALTARLSGTEIAGRENRSGAMEARAIMKAVRKLVHRTEAELEKGKISGKTAMKDIKLLLEKGWSTQLVWEEVYELTELKRKLVDSEAKRMKDLEAYMTAEEGMALVATLVGIAAEFVQLEQMPEFSERVATVMKMTKSNFNSPVEEVITGLRTYEQLTAGIVETSPDRDGVYYPEDVPEGTMETSPEFDEFKDLDEELLDG